MNAYQSGQHAHTTDAMQKVRDVYTAPAPEPNPSQLAAIASTAASHVGDLGTVKGILEDIHVALVGHSGLAVAGESAVKPGVAPVTGLLDDIAGYQSLAAGHLSDLRMLANGILNLLRRS